MAIQHRNHVTTIGDHGPVLLYGHGFGCNQSMWDAVTPAFSSSCQQILFDYVGSGQSDLSAFDAHRYSTLNGYAQDLLDVCEACNLHQDVIFVGHSVSCSIGMLAAIARPRLFKHLILVGPNPCFVNHPPDYLGGFERSDLQDLLDLMDRNFMGWAEFLAPVAAGQSALTSKRLNESFCSTDPLMARVFSQTTFFSDNRADLPKLKVPCLILQNRHDALAPLSVGEYLHQHLPSSEIEILEVAGHCAHMSHPELVIHAIERILQAG